MKSIYEPAIIDIVLDNISSGVQAINRDGQLIFSNRIVAMLDDINIKDSLGKHLLEVYPSLTAKTSTLLRVLNSGQAIYDFEQDYSTYKGKTIHALNTTLPIIREGEVIGAVEISKDITDVKKLSETVHILREKTINKPSDIVDDDAVYTFADILSVEPKMQRLKSRATRAARSDMHLLVSGETGTGKELLVQSIHNAGKRLGAPFIAQNCAALPSTLLESILFGTKKGSFTGSVDRPGLFEIAGGGTLFLDEINSMPMELQAKLLRVLQEGKIRRVGDVQSRKVDVRVIAASNMDPLKAVEDGKLRRDLYYRLNSISLEIPPLRDRKQDILPLTMHFIEKFNDQLYLQVRGLTKKVESLFLSYSWPGNIRELEHVIKGAMHILDGKNIRMMDIPSYIAKESYSDEFVLKSDDLNLKHAILQLEKQMIEKAMEASDDNVTQAAKMLGLPRQTLQYKLSRLGIK
ncbi:sigma-54-dependent Fis family transcriptional regulator [Acidaminobacter sp. JC074]|uniref:sigma-54 interaction domain-containing protein n=1 Tax=Acidaminobacter sp. JC074 TaxID=2530199 RepID=UPI001F0FAD0D|nr:sigma 54-interacting transcriptional regulator [Acidaminobacter sp. JC074]MCH4886940.1 sigma-54-dependent Fis family transcriptional regulator [Acidaminobacter sp. JC074]